MNENDNNTIYSQINGSSLANFDCHLYKKTHDEFATKIITRHWILIQYVTICVKQIWNLNRRSIQISEIQFYLIYQLT